MRPGKRVGSGIQYNRARFYNQNIAQFISSDPQLGNIHAPKSLHRYTYASINPINASDPSGAETIQELNEAVEDQAILTQQAFATTGRQAGGKAARNLGKMVEDGANSIINQCLKGKGSVKKPPKMSGAAGNTQLDFLVTVGNLVQLVEVKYQIPTKSGAAFERLVKQLSVAAEHGFKPILFVKKYDKRALKRLEKAVGKEGNAFQLIGGFADLAGFMGQLLFDTCSPI